MERKNLLYEGTNKRVYETDDPALVIVEYKDDAIAHNGAKKGTITGKGVINNRITNVLMQMLEEQDIPTHFVAQHSEREAVVRRARMIPLKVTVRNVVAGSLSTRVGLPEGTRLKSTILEYRYKNDALGDPLINRYHAFALEICTREELDVMDGYAFRANAILRTFLAQIGIELVDFKMEFGRLPDGSIVLADEISPDTSRLWDMRTGEKLDKDRFRRDLGGAEDAYQEVFRRIVSNIK